MTMINEHWGANDLKNGYANIYCPTISEDRVNSFGDSRRIYKELKMLEKILKNNGFYGWVSWTEIKNKHIEKLFVKVKSYPFFTDKKKEITWFKKEF